MVPIEVPNSIPPLVVPQAELCEGPRISGVRAKCTIYLVVFALRTASSEAVRVASDCGSAGVRKQRTTTALEVALSDSVSSRLRGPH